MENLDIRSIDTVLLDLGGVLLDVDYHRTAQSFAQLGVGQFDELYTKAKQDHLFDRFETGSISPAEFRDEVRKRTASSLSDEEIDHCWNAMLGSLPKERLELVASLKKRMPTLLLSNTNAIHVASFTRILSRENGVEDFKGLFHGAYYSNELGKRKPHVATFLHVLEQHGAHPERTLFIDDSPHHVEGARKAGLQGFYLDLQKEDVIAGLTRIGFI